MKFFPLLLAALPAIFVCYSCNSTNQASSIPGQDDSHHSRNSLDWTGTYTAILPCADCPGIQREITLNKDSTYTINSKYLGNTDSSYGSAGTFTWDSQGNKITLDNKAGPANYSVGENRLTQLDSGGRPMPDGYILSKGISDIVEKYWKLVELNGRKITPPQTGREAYMILKAVGNRVVGHSGCNSFTGGYELTSGNRLSFSQIVATRMACVNMETENQLFRVLEMVDNYTANGDTLLLNRARMAPLAKFEAVYLR